MVGHRYRSYSSSSVPGQFSSRSDGDLSDQYVGVSSPVDLDWPFGKIDSLNRSSLMETAYEIFFVACRSSPGFGGRNSSNDNNVNGGEVSVSSPTTAGRANGVGLVGTSKIKKALGLKTKLAKRGVLSSSSQPCNVLPSSAPSSPRSSGRFRRPLTSAEIMRIQMRVTEQSDHRLRKTLMRTVLGQAARKAETTILPLELLRQIKPSEFTDIRDYHLWQKRQLKILEAGLLLYPSISLDHAITNPSVLRLQEIIRAGEIRPVDTSKNSDTMRTLYNCVMDLARRGGSCKETCHWIDGYAINVHVYVTLLQSIFDVRDETVVLDDVDELLELMKKTWLTLGITRMIHNVCFAWVLFQQFVQTGQVEMDLLSATTVMLSEILNDVTMKKAERDLTYGKLLSATLISMQGWAERRLLDYHDSFGKDGGGDLGLMENVIPLALLVSRINGGEASDDRVHFYITSSLRNAFNKLLEDRNHNDYICRNKTEAPHTLLQLARETVDLAAKEKEYFTPILKKHHTVPASIAAVTLQNCYGVALRQFLSGETQLSLETLQVLQTAGKLEKMLIQMAIDGSSDCNDDGKSVIGEMVPFEVESIVKKLLKSWICNRLILVQEVLSKAKDTETWSWKSKMETHAASAVELMKAVKETLDDYFDIPVSRQWREEDSVVYEMTGCLEVLILEYIGFVTSCGTKSSYLPRFPPLTRCNQQSRLRHLWRKASPCKSSEQASNNQLSSSDHDRPRPSTSRGTQRLYVRLNTLHYIRSKLNKLNYIVPTPRRENANLNLRFDAARASIESAIQHVSEVAAFRLIFLDSSNSFYEGLYSSDIANSGIRPAIRTLKQNLTFLATVLSNTAQNTAVREVMKATFEAFSIVLLAGGKDRAFSRGDHELVAEDFGALKRVFTTRGEGLVEEEIVEREATVVEGVLDLMSLSTDQLIDDFNIVSCEAIGIGIIGGDEKVPMPPTTGRWNRTEPNTMLRVLCHRNDEVADRFLDKTFQLPKRR
ncbi:hypothetical protein ZOSMA_202G00430 [Zostera marina]|uniref:Uncharacterized protein n=1 Tax=Zostera marina TaxID=29655 RepID=A0A0K9PLU5_ZOSMR|nr:hypothetical protein ZOSMA_202G00430 [Zostera marina]